MIEIAPPSAYAGARLVCALALIAMLSGCGARGEVRPGTETSEEEARVHVAVLDSMGARTGAAEVVVVELSTLPLPHDPDAPARERVARLPGIVQSTIDDLVRRNARQERIGPLAGSTHVARLLDPTDLAGLADGESDAFWSAFNARFPDASGFFTLSRPGLSESTDQAVVVVEHRCGPRCGTGYAVLLVRRPDGWRITAEQVLWIS